MYDVFIDMVVPLCLLSFFRIFGTVNRPDSVDGWWFLLLYTAYINPNNIVIKNYDKECTD